MGYVQNTSRIHRVGRGVLILSLIILYVVYLIITGNRNMSIQEKKKEEKFHLGLEKQLLWVISVTVLNRKVDKSC